MTTIPYVLSFMYFYIQYQWIPDVNILLKIVFDLMKKRPHRYPEIDTRYPLLAIEGSEGSGKSSECYNLFNVQCNFYDRI